MIEVEVFGAEGRSREGRAHTGRLDAGVDTLADPGALPPLQEVRRLCAAAAAAAGVYDGHLAVEFVDEPRIAELNARYRAREGPTDVLSFPVDGAEPAQGARELGDVVICLARTSDVREAIVHGVLHLVGMDHESDDGEMLSLQHELLARERMTRSGFVALAGRPNVGKSTLVNAIVGDKVAIVSDRPQTTRRPIRGIRSNGDCQLVLVDLPGVQRPRDALTNRMASRVQLELAASDAALLVLNGEQGVGPGDRFIAAKLAEGGLPVTVAVNKIDRLSRAATASALSQAASLPAGEDVFPISARTGTGVAALIEHLESRLPVAPFMFGERATSDLPAEVVLGELVREAVIARTFQEIPHAIEVMVEDIDRPREGLARVRGLIWVESASQKGIVIGAHGRMIKAIGTAARREMERKLGCQVHLDLSVRIRDHWRGDDALLDRLGIT